VDSRQVERCFRWSAVVCGAIGVLLWVGVYLPRPDMFNNDAAQHVFWLYRYADPAVFPHDPAADYFGSLAVASWGYRGLYALLAPMIDVVLAAKLVAAVLLACSVSLAWCIGASSGRVQDRHLRGLCMVTALMLLLPLESTDLFTPLGLQRAFALPTTLLLLWALVTGRYLWVGVSWLIAALVYPVILPVLGLTGATVLMLDLVRDRRMPRNWLSNLLLGIVAIWLTLTTTTPSAEIGPTVTYAQALNMPEFLPGGRLPLYWISPGMVPGWLRDHHTGLGHSAWVVCAVLAALGVLGWRRRLDDVPRAAWVLASVGIGLWLVARATMFALYLPNRHSRTSFGIFAALTLAAAGAALVRFILDRAFEPGDAAANRAATIVLACLAPLTAAAALLPHAIGVSRTPVNSDLERVYAYLSGLPVDTLVAAHPDLADFVPVRSRRAVLASTEESIPFHLGYYARLKPRIQASLRAAYASDWQEFDAALVPFGATVAVSGPEVWAEDSYYPPFDGLVRELRRRGAQRGFVLRRPDPDRVLFRSGEYYVVRVHRTGG